MFERPRYELKYVIEAERALRFAELASEVMEPDPAHPTGYIVNSLYFDTPDLRFYFEKIDGVDPRFKVRVRWYGTEAPERLFLEIKHRTDQMLAKTRVPLPAAMVSGGHLDVIGLADRSEAQDREDAMFIEGLLSRLDLRGWCLVRYFRRPYLTRVNPTLRLTIDTDLRVLPPDEPAARGEGEGKLFLPLDLSVLELKFHYAAPLWLGEMVRYASLAPRRYSKYGSALEALHPSFTVRSVRRPGLGPRG